MDRFYQRQAYADVRGRSTLSCFGGLALRLLHFPASRCLPCRRGIGVAVLSSRTSSVGPRNDRLGLIVQSIYLGSFPSARMGMDRHGLGAGFPSVSDPEAERTNVTLTKLEVAVTLVEKQIVFKCDSCQKQLGVSKKSYFPLRVRPSISSTNKSAGCD